jgi:hypothetical protein
LGAYPEIANWYGSEQRTVEIASQTAVWYSTGLPAVPVRWVLVSDPEALMAKVELHALGWIRARERAAAPIWSSGPPTVRLTPRA